MLTRNDLIRIIARPLNMEKKYLDSVVKKLLWMDEFEFLAYAETIIPGRINRIIKNRYYIS